MHTFLRPIAKKHSLGFKNLSLLRNTASSSLRANRSITIQLHYPRLESTAFLSYSGTPIYALGCEKRKFYRFSWSCRRDRLIEM
jgi:hypothetical protein